MKKKCLIITILLIIISVIILVLVPKTKNIPEPTTDYVAIIYHSEMLGVDAGTEYLYYIYPNGEDKYIYVKAKSEITIEGSGEEERVTIDEINSESELKKIKNDISKDKTKDSETNISYTYLSNGTTINCTSFDELSNKLFK